MIKQSCLVFLSLAVIYCLCTYLFQRSLIYIPDRTIPSREVFHANDMQIISLTTSDNLRLMAWYKPALPKKPTVLILHGNGGNVGYMMPLVRQFLAVGYGALLVEYRGYGGNQGQPYETGLYRDGEAAMAFLHQQGVTNKHIILYGVSLGTGVATQLAATHQVCAVILQSPFVSLSAMTKLHYPWIPLEPWDKFDSLSRIKAIKAPLLIVHGIEDKIVPYQQGQILFNAALEPKQWLALPEKNHNNMWDKNFYRYVLQFIDATTCR